jgi:hypothetical protein
MTILKDFAHPDDRLDVRSLLESQRQSPAPEIQLIDKHVDHPHRVEAERPVYGLHSGRSSSTHPPRQIIQNYNSTGVFTQPQWRADIRP